MTNRTTTKSFFNHFQHKPTINLLDELVMEHIQQFGMDMYYLPRRRQNMDQIYYEDPTSKFDTAYQIPIYIKSAEGFMGQEALMTHFGIETRLQLNVVIARGQWEINVRPHEELWRPYEGDLIHLPDFDHRTYEIKFVDEHPYFYQHGHLPMWELTIELWEYGNEELDTGIEAIDCMATHTSINAYDWAILTEEGETLMSEDDEIITTEAFRTSQEDRGIIDSNDDFIEESGSETANTADDVIIWDSQNPFGETPWS